MAGLDVLGCFTSRLVELLDLYKVTVEMYEALFCFKASRVLLFFLTLRSWECEC